MMFLNKTFVLLNEYFDRELLCLLIKFQNRRYK